MKLIDKENWYARIYGVLKTAKQDPEMQFPLNIGSATITSEDGSRQFILDAYQTEYTVNENGDVTFRCYMEIDKETFPDCPYDLLVEDLKDCRCQFYCPAAEEAQGVYYDNTLELTLAFTIDGEDTHRPAVQEDSSWIDQLMSLRRRWKLEDYQEAYGDEWDEIPQTPEECWEEMQGYIAQTYDEDLILDCLEDEWGTIMVP